MHNNLNVQERLYGIDFLRIISMIMIVTLHILGQGKVLDNSIMFTAQYEGSWFMEIAAFCGVDCFALISGFVSYGKKTKYSNILNLYFRVVFYSLIITLLFQLSQTVTVSWRDYLFSVFPFNKASYWYFTAYFAMFFFTPLFHVILEHLTKKQGIVFFSSVFMVMCVFTLFMKEDMFGLDKGYSVIWLSTLYLLGGCIRKFEFGKNRKPIAHLRNYFILILITWLSKFLIQKLHSYFIGVPGEGMHFVSYISPTIFLASIELLLFFQSIKMNAVLVKLVAFFSPVVFDVYLIHEHPFVENRFIEDRFGDLCTLTPVALMGAVILIAILIWFICSLLGWIRVICFKAMKVDRLSETVVKGLTGLVNKLITCVE